MQEDADMADWEEAAGISAPLYEIVDTVFELQSRGFFRRQVNQDTLSEITCPRLASCPCNRLLKPRHDCRVSLKKVVSAVGSVHAKSRFHEL